MRAVDIVDFLFLFRFITWCFFFGIFSLVGCQYQNQSKLTSYIARWPETAISERPVEQASVCSSNVTVKRQSAKKSVITATNCSYCTNSLYSFVSPSICSLLFLHLFTLCRFSIHLFTPCCFFIFLLRCFSICLLSVVSPSFHSLFFLHLFSLWCFSIFFYSLLFLRLFTLGCFSTQWHYLVANAQSIA